LVFSSSGGTSLNKWLHYTYDSNEEKDYAHPASLYSGLISSINFAKAQLVTDGYTVGHIIMIWL